MANTFADQANARFDRATAFLNSSRMLLRNDLIYVSALADAVSAIKNMLQGYVLTQIATRPQGTAPQSWQEAAASNSMPDLLRAAAEAGLRLPNLLGPRINQLNRDRNYRAHDDPKRLIDYARAQEAIGIAEEVRRTIRATLGLAPAKPVPAPVAATATAPVASAASAGGATPTAPPAAVPRAPVPGATLGSDEPDESDEDVSPRLRRGDGLRRVLRALGRVAAVLLLLLVGIAAGVGIMIPITSGHAPSWLNFATRLLPTQSSSAATTTPMVTATQTPSGPVILGTVTVSQPVCRGGQPSFALYNTGAAAVQWAVASPGAKTPAFVLGINGAPQPALFGSLASTSLVTIYITKSQPVVVTTSDGAVQLSLPTC
jgi:hypothetical protein